MVIFIIVLKYFYWSTILDAVLAIEYFYTVVLYILLKLRL